MFPFSFKGDESYQYEHVSVMVDGMSIRKHLSYDATTKAMVGYVDYGSGGGQEESKMATEMLCFMAVGVRGLWKLPIGYYLINGR